VSTEQSYLSFDVPGGRLTFGSGDLDGWAEHLTWCYRMLGVPDGATIAVQDFGSSPLSFLGSRLLMPWLGSGIAERIGGRFICLDASAERVTLTPALMAQLSIDALVIRQDVLELLDGELLKRGLADLAHQPMKIIAVIPDEPQRPDRAESKTWPRLLHIESALILAPECARCGCFHLRHGVYEATDQRIHNLWLGGPPYELHSGAIEPPSRCRADNRDCCLRLPGRQRDNL
jgi:hypothetical protein